MVVEYEGEAGRYRLMRQEDVGPGDPEGPCNIIMVLEYCDGGTYCVLRRRGWLGARALPTQGVCQYCTIGMIMMMITWCSRTRCHMWNRCLALSGGPLALMLDMCCAVLCCA